MKQMFENADKTVQEARDFYHKIKSIDDNTGYSQSYQLGQMWVNSGNGGIGNLISIINSDVSAVESIRLVDRYHYFAINPSDAIKEKMVDWYIAYLMGCGHNIFDVDITIQESSISNPANNVKRANRLLTPDFLRTVNLSLEIQKFCSLPKSNLRIVELGGGCGHLARTLKLFMPNSVHVDIDLPETLYFAYIFLKLNFPHAKTCYVTDPSQLKDGIQEFDFVFIPTIFADSILEYEFDLFCNTASLGEMPNSTIRHWMHFVQDRLRVKYFFGLNRFLNTISLHDEFGNRRLGENESSVLFDANWRILHWELEPPFARCPYEEPGASRNLEIVAERLPETNERDNALLSQQILEDVMYEDWFRLPNRYIHGSMRSNVLANDLTMNGTLFKLWESIRLYPNKTNVAMMIKYLHTLTKTGCPFEELFYYENLLKNLISSDDSSQYSSIALDLVSEENYEGLWKDALALVASYYPSKILTTRLYRGMRKFLGSIPLIKRTLNAYKKYRWGMFRVGIIKIFHRLKIV